ncbi:MAG: hypothetical protein Q9222_002154 [Ikaeria aurantiellina]
MSTENPESPRSYNVDDSQANVEDITMQNFEVERDGDEQESGVPRSIDLDVDRAISPDPSPKPEIIDVDGYDTDVEILDQAPSTFNRPLIKKESHGRRSASPQPPIKVEPVPWDVWVDTGKGKVVIDLTDSDKEMEEHQEPNPVMAQPLSRSPVAKAKPASNTVAALKETQKKLAAKFRRQHAAGASSIFGGDIPAASSSIPTVTDLYGIAHPDDHGVVVDDDSDTEAASKFIKVQEAYERKKKLGTNRFEDDVMWGKARAAERGRLMRIEEANAYQGIQISTEEASESDEGLFLPEGSPSSSRKRPHSDIINDDEDDDVIIMGKGKEVAHRRAVNATDPKVDMLGSERETNSRPLTPSKPSKKRLAKAHEKDQEGSLMAGLDVFIAKEGRQKGQKGTSRNKARANKRANTTAKRSNEKRNAKGKKAEKTKRPTQDGWLLNTDSLMGSNVYDEANRNLELPAAPRVWDSRKKDALAAMLISVPLENLRKARSEKQHLLKATQILGKNGRCYHAGDKMWGLKGMSTTLYSHQVQGAAWMMERETGKDEPLGGILADYMGIGKTLEILACMVANRPAPFNPTSILEATNATLIVCNSSLVAQWEQEIETHLDEGIFRKVVRYHSGSRISGSGRRALILCADIVITTYDEVRRSYPKFKPPEHIVLPEKKREWWEENFQQMRDVLHQVRWHRIILDEAQAIKNRASQTSIACRGLLARHRWAVTATPIQNSVEELYAYFKLLRVEHVGTFQTFKENLCDEKNPDCWARLHTFLRRIMMRRTLADRFMGHPLIVLPRNNQKTMELDLNPVERALYDTVNRRFIEVINNHGRNGTLEKRYSNILHMLLRLRQMTAHPFMLQDTIEKLFKLEDIERLSVLTLSDDSVVDNPTSKDMLPAMKKMIKAKWNPREATPDVVSDVTPSEGDGEETLPIREESPSSALVFDFRRILSDMVKGEKWDDYKARSVCHSCEEAPQDPWVTDCWHLYCRECLENLVNEAGIRGTEPAACCECSSYFRSTASCRGIAELQLQTKDTPPSTPPVQSMAPQRNKEKEDLKWINYPGEVLPSTKTAAVRAQIEEWRRDDPGKKIIVFSQFHTLMTVLDKMFSQQGWSFVKYNGRMGRNEREKAIKKFRDESECDIMIASLKAGGVGLNLTMASKVICVDLWWNSCVEQQAFCRVFRIGQESETFITRFVAKNTVDQKLLEMQKKKEENVKHAIDDEKMLEALTIRELMGLFGDVQLDENDKPFIVVDDKGEFDKEEPLTML